MLGGSAWQASFFVSTRLSGQSCPPLLPCRRQRRPSLPRRPGRGQWNRVRQSGGRELVKARCRCRAGRSPIGVGGTRGAVGSARQHVTSPHTHDARDPRASSRPGPSLSPQSLGVQLSFFHFNKKNQLIHFPHPIQFRCGLCTYKG